MDPNNPTTHPLLGQTHRDMGRKDGQRTQAGGRTADAAECALTGTKPRIVLGRRMKALLAILGILVIVIRLLGRLRWSRLGSDTQHPVRFNFSWGS
jgi:hypothetical protein